MQKKTIIMGIVICLLGIGYFLLNNIDGSISEYNVTMDSLKIVELYNRLKSKRKIYMDIMWVKTLIKSKFIRFLEFNLTKLW